MKCKHLECQEEVLQLSLCEYHLQGGIFGTGETYEQYQIIEEDFLNFIKIIPLSEKNNLIVYSPLLRDIIIRTCVQIELFFKEWAKFDHHLDNTNHIYNSYNKVDKRTGQLSKTRYWYFKDYFFLKEKYLKFQLLHVRDLNLEINNFDDWKFNDDVPDWWNAYNSIKHDGVNNKHVVNLQVTLNALSALFGLHCANGFTRSYLQSFSQITITKHFDKVYIKNNEILTPIDSKKYLFKDVMSSMGRGFEMSQPKKIDDRISSIGKKI